MGLRNPQPVSSVAMRPSEDDLRKPPWPSDTMSVLHLSDAAYGHSTIAMERRLSSRSEPRSTQLLDQGARRCGKHHVAVAVLETMAQVIGPLLISRIKEGVAHGGDAPCLNYMDLDLMIVQTYALDGSIMLTLVIGAPSVLISEAERPRGCAGRASSWGQAATLAEGPPRQTGYACSVHNHHVTFSLRYARC